MKTTIDGRDIIIVLDKGFVQAVFIRHILDIHDRVNVLDLDYSDDYTTCQRQVEDDHDIIHDLQTYTYTNIYSQAGICAFIQQYEDVVAWIIQSKE